MLGGLRVCIGYQSQVFRAKGENGNKLYLAPKQAQWEKVELPNCSFKFPDVEPSADALQLE